MIAKRIDRNQTEIVDVLRRSGCSVLVLSGVGRGCPDLLMGLCGQNFLIEVKDGKKPPSGRKLTRWEEIFIQGWLGNVAIIESVEQAINLVNKIKNNML